MPVDPVSSALSRLATSAVGAAQRAYGTTADAALVPSARQKLVRQIFFKPVGTELLKAELVAAIKPWFDSNHISEDAAIEGLQALEVALGRYQPDAAALMALADPSGLFRQLQDLTPEGPTSADGAKEVYQYALHQLIESLRRLAPRADGMAQRSITYLITAVGELSRSQVQFSGVMQDQVGELLEILRGLASGVAAAANDTTAADGLDHAALIGIFSTPRMQRYQELMGTDQGALRLYRWNVEISAELYRGLSVVEVAMRNAMDQQLRAYNERERGTQDWITAPAPLISTVMGASLVTGPQRAVAARLAKLGLRNDKAPAIRAQLGHDDFVAQMTFSTWYWALPHSKAATRQRRLWYECLWSAFPGREQGDIATLAEHVRCLHITRNRVAHLEPILDRARTRADFRSICWILEAISPDAFEYYVSGQQITSILSRKPERR